MSGQRTRWRALTVLCVSLAAIVIDNTIVNVALPTMGRDLDAELSELQWVVDAYTLVFAGLLLAAGAVGDRYGRRRTLLLGLVVFGTASMAAAWADSAAMLIASRALMGVGAACVMPATLSLITSIFDDEHERATAVGIWAATAGLGVALGPVVGGFLLDHYWWGSIFLVNVPLCVVAFVTGREVVPESRDSNAAPIDWTSVTLSGVALTAFVWAVIEAPAAGWTSARVVAASAITVVTGACFLIRQRRVAHPLLELRLFRNPGFSAASVAIMVLFFCLFGFLFLSTQYLQAVLGYSPLGAGVRVLPYAGAMIVCASASGALVSRFGRRQIATLGMTLFAAGLFVAATIAGDSDYRRLAFAFVLMGAGMGLAGAPATDSISAALPPDRANTASAVNDATREVGGALGVAIVGSLASALYTGQTPGAHLGARLDPEAFTFALSRSSLVAAVVAVFGAILVWRYLPATVRGGTLATTTRA